MLIGIVGKPSTGKSTFFKAATLAEAETANYPFTTIKPNHAVGFVKVECADKFFNKQCDPRTGFCLDHNRFVPVELMDVAGLVEGAHEGAGMGNQFLDDLRKADVFLHIVDISGSTNNNGEPVEPLSYDPLKDVEFLEKELDLWFLRLVNKGWDKFSRQVQQDKSNLKKAVSKQLSGLGVTEDIAEDVLRDFSSELISWDKNEVFRFASTLRKKTKPMLIVANKADVEGADKNVDRLKEKYSDYKVIPCSSESEYVLRSAAKNGLIDYIPGDNKFTIKGDISDAQKRALEFVHKVLDRYGSTGVQDTLNYAVFDMLKYIHIFPGGVNKLEDSDGNTLPDCFLLKEGSTALDFAYKLHTDFGKNFIRAIDVKTKRTVGKEHLLKKGDVIEIISGH